jgi:D-serine deaminase-like pyridoxal phosphate-dependent protein
MGYEGHVVGLDDRTTREKLTADAMGLLLQGYRAAGGDIISAGGTGTYDINTWANEIQAGSYVLMDTAYAKLGLPFRQGLTVLAAVISVSSSYAVGDCGLKALGMDHGNPSIDGGHQVLFVSDEHITFVPSSPLKPGDRIRVMPAHIDPTIAYHERMHLVRGEEILETWPIDLRGW